MDRAVTRNSPARRLQLAGLARAMAAAGRAALPPGVALDSLELTVPVSEPPRLIQNHLWRLTVAMPVARWRGRLPSWLGGRRPGDWPWVKLTWSDGQVFAAIVPPPEFDSI